MSASTESSLHTNLQVANFQRCERASDSSKESEAVSLTSGVSEIAADPLSPLADDPSAPSSPTFLPLPVSNSSCPLIQCQPLYASYCTALLYFSSYSTVRLKMSIFCFYVLFV